MELYKKAEKMNNSNKELWFSKTGLNIISNRWKYLIVVFIVTILASGGLPKIELDSDFENWFPKSSKQFLNKQEYVKYFGNDDVVGIHLKADNVFSNENLQIIESLGDELEHKVPFVDKVTSITNLEYTFSVDDEIITEELLPESPSEADIKKAKQRILNKPYLLNKIVADDFKETWIIVELLPYPEKIDSLKNVSPANIVGAKVLDVLNQDKFKEYNLRAVGTPVYSFEEVRFAGLESVKLLSLTILILILFLALFFRSVKAVIIPLTSAIIPIVIIFGLMGYLSIKINAILFAVPVIFSLSISLGFFVHLMNYYNQSLANEPDKKQALTDAIAKSGWPTTFAALTTIGALLSFVSVGLMPIKWLGLTSASLVVVIYLMIFIISTTLLSFGAAKKVNKVSKASRLDRLAEKIMPLVLKNKKLIFTSLFFVVVVMVIGLFSFEVNFDTERSYGHKISYINRMLDVAKTKIGTFDSYNITIEFKNQDEIKKVEVLKQFDKFNNEVKKLALTKKTNSILTIIKDMNSTLYNSDTNYYKIPENKEQVAQLLIFYEMSGGSKLFDWTNTDFNVLRLKVETNNMNAGQTVQEINQLKSLSKELFPDAKFNITGGMPRLAAINHLVSIGQIKSLLIALMVISIMMSIVFGSVKLGLIGLIPNILPVLVIGGTMGLLNIPVDFLTVTIAPMILGIAVDDTIHLFNHIKDDYKKFGSYEKAVKNSIKHLSKAVIITSVIIILSFSVYLTSSLNMMIYLGLFVILGISTALISDLFITPLLILWLKPFGKKE